MELTPNQLHELMYRFPQFELSYETISHKKVSPNYKIALAVPSGRKYYLWFTYYITRRVCYLLELNKDRRIVRASLVNAPFSPECSLETVLYGTLVRENVSSPVFVLEDAYVYKGIPLKFLPFSHKLGMIRKMFETDYRPELAAKPDRLAVRMPFMWLYSDPNQVQSIIPDRIAKQIPYSVHHIQYRDLDEIRPYLNVPVGLKETNVETPTIAETHVSKYTPNFTKPQYKYPTVFRVMADVQYDIYHLYACGPADHTGNPFVYYDVAYVPNYEKSVFLNGLFRNIRENRNLDYIEESDDETDFEDTRLDKYVDLTKEVWMECVFLPKFRRWVPVRVVDRREKVVHIHKLTEETYGSKGAAPLRSSRCHQKSSGRISIPNPSLNENTHNGRYMNNYKGNHKRNYKGHISQGKGSVWKSSGRISDDRRFPE
jgi:hypothetical protein